MGFIAKRITSLIFVLLLMIILGGMLIIIYLALNSALTGGMGQ